MQQFVIYEVSVKIYLVPRWSQLGITSFNWVLYYRSVVIDIIQLGSEQCNTKFSKSLVELKITVKKNKTMIINAKKYHRLDVSLFLRSMDQLGPIFYSNYFNSILKSQLNRNT